MMILKYVKTNDCLAKKKEEKQSNNPQQETVIKNILIACKSELL